MNYLVLLYENPANFPSDGATRDAQFKAYGDFTEAIRASGNFVSGTPLIPMPDQTRTVKSSGVATGPAHKIPRRSSECTFSIARRLTKRP